MAVRLDVESFNMNFFVIEMVKTAELKTKTFR